MKPRNFPGRKMRRQLQAKGFHTPAWSVMICQPPQVLAKNLAAIRKEINRLQTDSNVC